MMKTISALAVARVSSINARSSDTSRQRTCDSRGIPAPSATKHSTEKKTGGHMSSEFTESLSYQRRGGPGETKKCNKWAWNLILNSSPIAWIKFQWALIDNLKSWITILKEITFKWNRLWFQNISYSERHYIINIIGRPQNFTIF